MPYTLTSTGVITQTGIDTSFLGIQALTGGSVLTQGNKDIYNLDINTRLVIEGTLSINGEFEELTTERRVPHDVLSNIIVSGTWNAGILKDNPAGTTSSTVYTKGTVWRQIGNIISSSFGPCWFNGGFGARDLGAHLAITPTGTVNLNGSTFAGPMMITVALGGTFESVYQAYIISDDNDRPAGNEWNCRYYKGEIDLGTVAQEGGIIQIEAVNSDGGSRLVLVRNNAGIGAWSQSGAENLAGVSFDPSNPGTNYTTLAFDGSNNVVDFCQYGNSSGGLTNAGATRLQDCPRGTDININGGETTGDQSDNWGYTWMTRRIGTNIVSLANGSNQKGAFYIKDYNETGNVRNPSTRNATMDDTPDAIYFGLFDGSLTSLSATGPYALTDPDRNNDTEILLAVHNLAAGGNRTRTAKNTGLWVWDDRSNTRTLGESRFSVPFWSYENNFFTLNDDLAGSNFTVGERHTYNFLTSVDTNVTNSRAIITTLSDTTLTSDFAINSDGTEITIGGSRDINLDELYDLCKYKKETSVVEIVKPTVDTLLISSDGTEIDLGGVTINFTGSAKLIKGTNHTKIKHNTTLDLSKFIVSAGMTVEAPTVTKLGDVAGTVKYTNNTTTSNNVNVAATGIIDSGTATTTLTGSATFTSVTDDTGLEPVVGATKGAWTVNSTYSIGGKHSGTWTCTATSGNSSVPGELTDTLTDSSTGRLTVAGILGALLSHVNGPITTTSTATFKAISAGAGVSNVDGTGIGNVSLLDGNSIVPADIDGTFTSTGGTVTLSGHITGVINANLLITTATFQCDSNLSTDGDGVNIIAGIRIGGFCNFDGDAGTGRNEVTIALIVGKLDMNGGVLNLVTSVVEGLVEVVDGTLETTSTFHGHSTVTITAAGANKLRGRADAKVKTNDGAQDLDINITAGGFEIGAGNSSVKNDVTGNSSIGAGDITLDVNLVGNLTTADGDITTGLNFGMIGVFNVATGTVTFLPNNSVVDIDLSVLAGEAAIILGKAAGDFDSVDVTSGGTITFPTAATHLDISLTSLPIGSHYTVYNDSVQYASGEVTVSTVNISLSNQASDGSRTHISSGLGGNWYLNYVDYNKQATFKGVTVTETSSTSVVAPFTLIPTEFTIAYEVPSAVVVGRSLTVSAADNTNRPEFDLLGCGAGNLASEAQSSLLVADARNSVNYLNAMARQLARDSVTVPTNGSVQTFDCVRPVLTGADWRNGIYFIKDGEDGIQVVSGWYNVDNDPSFSAGTRTATDQVNQLTVSTDANNDYQVISHKRVLNPASSITNVIQADLTTQTNTIIGSRTF